MKRTVNVARYEDSVDEDWHDHPGGDEPGVFMRESRTQLGCYWQQGATYYNRLPSIPEHFTFIYKFKFN